ncbi:MAG: hypothetical protein WCP73_06745, partial [Eubacteriales bacterium]
MQNLIQQTIAELDESKQLLQMIRGGQMPVSTIGVPQSAVRYFLSALAKETGRRVCFVSATYEEAKKFADDGKVFPAGDVQLRALAAKSRENAFERIELLFDHKINVIHMPVEALQQKMIPRELFYSSVMEIEVSRQISLDTLMGRFVQLGYERVETVYEKGQFARRGEIVDVFST